MQPDLRQVVEFLREHKYLLVSRGKYVLSASFQDAMQQLKKGAVIHMDTDALPKEEISLLGSVVLFREIKPVMHLDWQQRFINFISDAKVPQWLENNKLERYAVNKYSEDGMKAFKAAMESGVNYDLLVKSTMLYYKSATRFKKAIGNYMKDGDWRTDYQALAESATQGEQQLRDHIKTQIHNDRERDPYD